MTLLLTGSMWRAASAKERKQVRALERALPRLLATKSAATVVASLKRKREHPNIQGRAWDAYGRAIMVANGGRRSAAPAKGFRRRRRA